MSHISSQTVPHIPMYWTSTRPWYTSPVPWASSFTMRMSNVPSVSVKWKTLKKNQNISDVSFLLICEDFKRKKSLFRKTKKILFTLSSWGAFLFVGKITTIVITIVQPMNWDTAPTRAWVVQLPFYISAISCQLKINKLVSPSHSQNRHTTHNVDITEVIVN